MGRTVLLLTLFLLAAALVAWGVLRPRGDEAGADVQGVQANRELAASAQSIPDLLAPVESEVRESEVDARPLEFAPGEEPRAANTSHYDEGSASGSETIHLQIVDKDGKAQPNYPLVWVPKWYPEGTPEHIYDNKLIVADSRGSVSVRYWRSDFETPSGSKVDREPGSASGALPVFGGCTLRSQVPWHADLVWELTPNKPMPTRLVVPDSGAVRVVLKDPAGKPWPLRTRVHASYETLSGTMSSKSETAKPGAKTMLAFLPYGQAITIGAISEGPAETVWQAIEPLQPGEDPREVTLVLTDPTFRLSGELQTPLGKPLPSTPVYFVVPGFPRVQFLTDDAGGFRAKFPFGGRMTVQLQAGLYGAMMDHGVAVDTLPLRQGVDNDLGKLRLQPLPGFLVGTVWLGKDRPAVGLTILAELRDGPGALVNYAAAKTDERGRFQFQGDRFDRPLILRHQASFKEGARAFVFQEPVKARPEEGPLQITLVRSAQLAGQLSLPTGSEYEVWVRYLDGNEARVPVQPGGRYYSDDLAPGLVTLHIVRKGSDAAIATLPDVSLLAGPQKDVRLRGSW